MNDMVNSPDRLTFAQREGKTPLPESMQLEHLSRRFRQLAWLIIDRSFFDFSSDSIAYAEDMGGIISRYKFDVLEEPHTDIRNDPKGDREYFKQILLYEDYHVALTLVEFVIRQRPCPNSVKNSLIRIFDRAPGAYFVKEINGIPTIMPRPSREAGEATQQAIETIHEGGMDGAATHLRQAVEHINAQQYADSSADSISAVESVARMIDPEENGTLGLALDSLERFGLLRHRALKDAFKKLYGYTSDEQGIRHALLDQASPNVGLDEAMFMFGACASFAAYLTNKHQQTETE